MAECEHKDFAAFVKVERFEDIGRFMAEVKIHCAECEEPFRFLGIPSGIRWEEPAGSVDGLKLRAPIEPQGEKQIAARSTFEVPEGAT